MGREESVIYYEVNNIKSLFLDRNFKLSANELSSSHDNTIFQF